MSGIIHSAVVKAADISVPLDDVLLVEGCAAKAWPPSQVTDLNGWQLRYSPGVSNRRANSVLPIFGKPADRLSEQISQVEEFYQARNLPARFMVSPASRPQELDRELERLGYSIDAPTYVQWASTDDVVRKSTPSTKVELIPGPTDTWMSVYMEGVSDGPEISLKAKLINRIKADHVLAQVSDATGPLAVGLGVFDQAWAGVFCMHTLKAHRRRGLARQILGALANWSLSKQAANMYLQVECDNPTAQAFYAASGFVTHYGYHYRTKELRRVSQ